RRPFIILRHGITYGPRMRDELVIPSFLRNALNDKPIIIAGDDSQFRNFVYVEDLVEAHVSAISAKAQNQAYNLEGFRPITIREIAETIRRLLKNGVRRQPRLDDYVGKQVFAENVKNELGWESKTDFEEGMRRHPSLIRRESQDSAPPLLDSSLSGGNFANCLSLRQ